MSKWPEVDLRDLTRLQSGYSFKSAEWRERGTRVVKIANLKFGALDLSNSSFVDEVSAARASRFMLRPGDVLLAMTGASVGEAARVTTDERLLLNQRVGRFEVLDLGRLDPRFLFYFLRLASTREQIVARAHGSAQPNLSAAALHSIRILLPQLADQIAISELFSALDVKVAANRRLAHLSFELARLVFTKSRANAAAAEPLSSVATTVLGGTPSRARREFWVGGTVPWLNSGKANEDRITEPTDYITEEALACSAAKLMPSGSTVVAITGATLGQVARLELPASGNQSLVGIWSEDSAMNDWLHFSIRESIPELLKRSTGAAQQHVNKGDIDALMVSVPRGEVLSAFHSQAGPLLEIASNADRESRTLTELRNTLLPELMSGRLRVKDAEKKIEEVV